MKTHTDTSKPGAHHLMFADLIEHVAESLSPASEEWTLFVVDTGLLFRASEDPISLHGEDWPRLDVEGCVLAVSFPLGSPGAMAECLFLLDPAPHKGTATLTRIDWTAPPAPRFHRYRGRLMEVRDA